MQEPNPGMSTTTYGAIYDGHNGYSMNVSVASLLGPWNNIQTSGIFGLSNVTASIQAIVPDKEVIVGANGQNDARGNIPGFLRAISLASPTWGQTLWTESITVPLATTAYPNNTYNGAVSMGSLDVNSGVLAFTEAVSGKVWVYSIATGQQLWTMELTYPWYYQGTSITFHDGFGYTINTAGIVNCYNATTRSALMELDSSKHRLHGSARNNLHAIESAILH